MVIRICPTVDFAFKKMFGSPEHTAVTIHFLNAILGGNPRIVSIKILNPSLGKDSEDDKLPILDILAIDEHGRMLNIEMQTTLPVEMPQRLTYYVSRLYVSQLTAGREYIALRPAITICVLAKLLDPATADLHQNFQLRNASGKLLTDHLQIHFLELPKLRVTAENVSQASPIEQWAYFLQNVQELSLEEVEQMFPDQEFSEAAGVLEMIARTPEQEMLYEARLKFQRDEASKLGGARREGKEEGLREGEEKGLRKGALLGRIALLKDLLRLTAPTADELSNCGMAQLSKIEDELQSQLRNRGQ